MDDAQLLRHYAQNGSEAAFAELVGRYFNLVHSAAVRRVGGDVHRAKDVAQTVFADLARKASLLARHPCLVGWLYTSTYFAASQLMRTERRRKNREGEAHSLGEFSSDPAAGIDWDHVRPVLDDVMHDLGDPDRKTILWRFFDAQSLAAVGRNLGVSENTARKRVDGALKKMRQSLTRHGVDSTTAALASMLGAGEDTDGIQVDDALDRMRRSELALLLADHSVIAAPAGLAEAVTAAALASAARPPERYRRQER